MSELSILGKKWIYKKYDASYINFLKENFYLDEITSKLLSIRNIDKNYIKTFLKPSIKNLIPDPNVLKDMKKNDEGTNYAEFNETTGQMQDTLAFSDASGKSRRN